MNLFVYLKNRMNFDKRVLIFGDLNLDCKMEDCSRVLNTIENKHKIRQVIWSSTTDYGSALDHIYTNIDANTGIQFGILESYYSDHKPVYASFPIDFINTSKILS